ncbi:hypothetical protein [Pseudoalteromonas sp. R3]|uniref:hypothetical protein n=1 Tax=Pseudoalteromonas sp. R3 TaxID=1709477 RepID=UPI0006B5A463|nr:hypothetical protein [Pseudoalteromonas sp. R3]AZZ98837.1 hypothetical protein ELR70_18070 [Pseudoalteromonas sp. R3]
MKKYLNGIISCALLTITFSSHAGNSGWTVASEVIKVVSVVNGGINVRLSPELSGCTSQSGYGPKYASVYPDHPALNAMHANLLAAYMSGKKVSLYLTDDTCKVGEMVIGGTHSGPPGS